MQKHKWSPRTKIAALLTVVAVVTGLTLITSGATASASTRCVVWNKVHLSWDVYRDSNGKYWYYSQGMYAPPNDPCNDVNVQFVSTPHGTLHIPIYVRYLNGIYDTPASKQAGGRTIYKGGGYYVVKKDIPNYQDFRLEVPADRANTYWDAVVNVKA